MAADVVEVVAGVQLTKVFIALGEVLILNRVELMRAFSLAIGVPGELEGVHLVKGAHVTFNTRASSFDERQKKVFLVAYVLLILLRNNQLVDF